jgi:hypothetical protein
VQTFQVLCDAHLLQSASDHRAPNGRAQTALALLDGSQRPRLFSGVKH